MRRQLGEPAGSPAAQESEPPRPRPACGPAAHGEGQVGLRGGQPSRPAVGAWARRPARGSGACTRPPPLAVWPSGPGLPGDQQEVRKRVWFAFIEIEKPEDKSHEHHKVLSV